ncbi:M48 family metalloprotease [Geothrix alkalitolerans]|uniref:M48 family metalloprotease n=1 Tax=Geothrix alkalitolerans TaxID=2922724 RepID=UPI001FAF0D51|nr:M48 family metalloprotease [Geothrix alkalitolerans]
MNRLKTFLLLSLVTALLVAFGARMGTGWLTLAIAAAFALNLGAYFWSHKLVLRMQGAEEMPEEEMPWLHREVAQLAAEAGIPKPRVYVIPDDAPNAFATGRNPEHGVVAFTEGILRTMPRRELRGVIAHELSHIVHRDILVATVAAALAGAVSLLAHGVQWGALLGGGREDEEGGSPLGGLLFALLAPLGASLIQFAISRSREYLADEGAARLTGDPEGLALALLRLGRGQDPERQGPTAEPATASLMIASPFAGGGLLRWFSTHPPIEDRVARLRAMAPIRHRAA